MSLVPEFELGFWNAWIFMVPSLLLMLLWLILMTKKHAPLPPKNARMPKTAEIFNIISKLIYFPAVICSVFMPLKLGAVWFYVGLPITLTGLVGSLMVVVNWASTQAGEPVTRGIYRWSRHPGYVTEVLLLSGVSIISASWVFLLFPLIVGGGAVYFIEMEEAQCIGHYGNAYREYMDRTPRWIGMPRHRKNNRED